MAPGFNPTLVIIVFALSIIVYVIPSIFAYGLNHPSRSNICIANLLLGWTVIAWVVCLYKALQNPHVVEETGGPESP